MEQVPKWLADLWAHCPKHEFEVISAELEQCVHCAYYRRRQRHILYEMTNASAHHTGV